MSLGGLLELVLAGQATEVESSPVVVGVVPGVGHFDRHAANGVYGCGPDLRGMSLLVQRHPLRFGAHTLDDLGQDA